MRTIPIPSSKSLTQRALLLAALADGPSEVLEPLDCDDSRHLRRALTDLGARFVDGSADGATRIRVVPAPLPLRAPEAWISCGNAGTAVRFLAPLALVCDGTLVLDGDEHMRRRPIGPLAESLASLGVEVEYLGARGFPPFALRRSAPPPRRVRVDTTLSSQYASGLLLVAPLLAEGLEIELAGARVSGPYLAMTIEVLRSAGCDVRWLDEATLRVAPGRARGGSTRIERDWSAAAFVFVAAKITGADIGPEGLGLAERSLQGDAVITSFLASFDREATNVFDLTDAPDLVAPLAVAALFAKRPTRFRGAAHTRLKECDRLAVLGREFARLGARVEVLSDGLDLHPLDVRAASADVTLDPDDDHRMAMAFGLVSLRLPGVQVANRSCVTKSFPDFWEALERIRSADRAR